MDVFVIIPAYNEQRTIVTVVQELADAGYFPIVVDDGSANPLINILEGLPVFYLRHTVNMGQGAAIQTGIEFALANNASVIVTFDADGQHKASDLPAMIEHLHCRKLDIVLGSRFISGSAHNMPAARKRLLKLASKINYAFTGLMLTDAHNGLRVMNRKAASCIKLKQGRMAHATEILEIVQNKRLAFEEYPVTVEYTTYSLAKGQSNWQSFRIVFDLLLGKIFK